MTRLTPGNRHAFLGEVVGPQRRARTRVEDEYIIAAEIEQTCREAGATEVTVASRMGHPGLEPAKYSDYSFAVMELELHGAPTLELARALMDAGVPTVIGTAFDEWRDGVPGLAEAPVVTKPYAPEQLIEAADRAIASARRRGDEAEAQAIA